MDFDEIRQKGAKSRPVQAGTHLEERDVVAATCERSTQTDSTFGASSHVSKPTLFLAIHQPCLGSDLDLCLLHLGNISTYFPNLLGVIHHT